MAIHTTATGVRFSRGRGAASVALDISFREIERWADRNRVDTEKLHRRSFGRACSGLKKQLVEVMRQGGGINGVPRFRDYEAFTAELRREKDKDPTGPIGGVLADREKIVAYRRNGWQIIGWPDTLADCATTFQDAKGNEDLADNSWRAYIHRTYGIQAIPRSYVHNPRPVLPEPFGSHVRANLDQWADKIFYKELARQMQKSGGVAL